MTPTESHAVPPHLSRRQAILLTGALGTFFAVLAFVNGFWACYPIDNDLDEVGWLAAHLDLGRPESLANQGYPPGLPLLLRGLTPIVGSLLRAALLWQAVVATASVFFVFRIGLCVSRRANVAALGALCAALALLPLATTEFGDGTSTALLLAGLWALARRDADGRGFLLMGLASGLAYLFRTHYLILLALVPASLSVARFGIANALRLSCWFVAGFAATAWPLWLLNMLAYGTPLHAGVSQYNISFSMIPGAFDWEDYANTYQRWPLARILRERPGALAWHLVKTAFGTLSSRLSLAAIVLTAVALRLDTEAPRRRMIGFLATLAATYVFVVIVPTRLTARAYAPIAMLACLLVAHGLAQLLERSRRKRRDLLLALAAVVLVAYPLGLASQLRTKRERLAYNSTIVDVLVANGMRSSSEVFSNDWNLFNLADPQFITFYNYGGWIALDSQYVVERPAPHAKTLREWQRFFEARGIRFAIMRRRRDNEELFRRTPSAWKKLFSDKRVTVWALTPDSAGSIPGI